MQHHDRACYRVVVLWWVAFAVAHPLSANVGSTVDGTDAQHTTLIRLPEITANIPGDYVFQDTYYLPVGAQAALARDGAGFASVFLQIDFATAQSHSKRPTENGADPQMAKRPTTDTLVVLRELDLLFDSSGATGTPDSVNRSGDSVLSSASTSTSLAESCPRPATRQRAGIDAVPLCVHGMEHALKFVLDSDVLNRKLLIVLRKWEPIEAVVGNVSGFLGA